MDPYIYIYDCDCEECRTESDRRSALIDASFRAFSSVDACDCGQCVAARIDSPTVDEVYAAMESLVDCTCARCVVIRERMAESRRRLAGPLPPGVERVQRQPERRFGPRARAVVSLVLGFTLGWLTAYLYFH